MKNGIVLKGLEAEIADKTQEILEMPGLDAEQRAMGVSGASIFPVIARLGEFLYKQNISPNVGLPLLTASFANVIASVCSSDWFNDDVAEAMVEKLPRQFAETLAENFNLLKKEGRF